MQFDCLFEEFGPYDETMDWNSMRIDSVSVTPSSKGTTEAVYYANSTSFSEVHFNINHVCASNFYHGFTKIIIRKS